jgi:hypothetical protein
MEAACIPRRQHCRKTVQREADCLFGEEHELRASLLRSSDSNQESHSHPFRILQPRGQAYNCFSSLYALSSDGDPWSLLLALHKKGPKSSHL